ncbi:MAG: oligosaccharide flippase family protein [Bdellovibrionales bacterium]|nr:oligosaccharide flippase family protein [Bdellovibrionales bacterium]
MLKSILKDGLYYGFSQILFFGVPILMAPVYSFYVSPESFGALEVLQIVGILANFLVVLEIGQGLARHYADAHSDTERREWASTAMWFTFAAYAVFLTGTLAFAGPLCRWLLGSLRWLPVYRAALVGTTGMGIFQLFQNQLRWDLKPQPYAAAAGIFAIISTALGFICVAHLDTGIVGVFYGQIAGTLAGSIVSWYFGRHRFGLTFHHGRFRGMLHFSFPLVFSSISVFFASFIDRLAIKQLMTLADVGIYSIAFRFASSVNVAFLGISFALTPLIYRNYQRPETPGYLAQLFRLFSLVALIVLTLMTILARPLIQHFTPEAYHTAWRLVPVLSLSAIAARLYVFAPGLELTRRTRTIAVINSLAAVINIVINYQFIPVYGPMAAAVGTLVGALFAFGLQMLLSQRCYPAPHRFGRLAFVASAAALLLYGTAEASSPLVSIASGLIILGAGIAALTTRDERRTALNFVLRRN